MTDPLRDYIDGGINGQRRFLVNVHETIDSLLQQEDTSHNTQITVDDHGPKVAHEKTRDYAL